MRAISLVKRIEFEFSGHVSRNALTLGDVDNDGCIELVVGNDQGEVAIFKGQEKLQAITGLSLVACVAIGDIRNEGKNSLVIITADGWCYIYETPCESPDRSLEEDITVKENIEEVDGQGPSSSNPATETQSSSDSVAEEKQKNGAKEEIELKNPLICVHTQRIPANVKNIILGDVDGDGHIEMVLALTDRIVRSYRFIKGQKNDATTFLGDQVSSEGLLQALNKWECANQIGSITLHHSFDGKPSILVAQPGGTFMRIKCLVDPVEEDESEGSKKSDSNEESFPGSVDYQFLGISRMRNQNISTEIVGDLKSCDVESAGSTDSSEHKQTLYKSRPYALATLDGSIMLVQDEVILWAIAVDHQIFALTKLDITGNGCDDIIVCSWDGQTYILDQNKNSVRFHVEEPVKAFHCGYYSVDMCEPPTTALVYVTFKNSVIVCYDVPLKDLLCKRLVPDSEKLAELFIDKERNREQALEFVQNMEYKSKRDLIEYLLYDI